MESMLLDAAGHRRSPATMPGYHRGRPPRNKGAPPSASPVIPKNRTTIDPCVTSATAPS
jgi:hypothetical protein